MESQKKFRERKPAEYAERPVTPAEVLPEGDLVFFLLETIPRMDLSAFYAYYKQETLSAASLGSAATKQGENGRAGMSAGERDHVAFWRFRWN